MVQKQRCIMGGHHIQSIQLTVNYFCNLEESKISHINNSVSYNILSKIHYMCVFQLKMILR